MRKETGDVRQKTHAIDLPDTESQSQEIACNICELDHDQAITGAFGLETGKDVLDVENSCDGTLEEHKDHHDTKDLETVARHVHAKGAHGQLLGWSNGDFPGLLELQSVHFLSCRGFASRSLGDGILGRLGL
jgi:hypothetical protein